MSNIILDTKNVGKIKGLFYLPDYQRGYRWTSEEIKLLLDDIYESAGKPYCLQPIVVKKSNVWGVLLFYLLWQKKCAHF